jgi:hypothetical protein
MQNFDHNIGFWEKRHFFRRKLPKIAEICDHNIDKRAQQKNKKKTPESSGLMPKREYSNRATFKT